MKQKDIAKELIINLTKCEDSVKSDVIRRTADWLESGGDLNDDYVVNQLRYTQRHLELLTPRKKFDNQHGLC